MRIVVAFMLFCSSLVYASDLSIRTISTETGLTYVIDAGAFSVQKNAESLKNKLSKITQEPISIEHLESKGLFLVRIGPFNDYARVIALRKEIIEPKQDISQLPPLATIKHTKPSKSASKVWNLRNADIRAVIGEVSRVTGKNFIIDPRVQGKVSIASSTPISNKELYQVFLSMLQVSGYAAIASNDVIKIIPTIEAKSQSADLLNKMRNPPRGEEVMVEVIPVRYVPAEQLVPVLRPLMPPTSNVSAYAPSNMLILSGRANNIKQLSRIITEVDSSSISDIDLVPLHHALAMDIVNTLKDLVKTPLTGATQVTNISADDRSNAILISGSKTERIKLRMLIDELDRESRFANNNTTKVVYLSYRRAEDLVPILASIAQANFTGPVGTTIGTISQPALDSTNPTTSFATNSNSKAQTSATMVGNQSAAPLAGSGQSTTPTTSQSEGVTKPSVQIIGEPNTNSIVINAPASVIQILKSVISQLDIRPSQILIEALVAEINETDFKQLGIEWGSITGTGDNQAFSPGFAIINTKTTIDNFQAQVHALARERRANILSTPSVVVLDNRQAKILIGKQVSVATTSYPNNAGGSTTASPYTTFDRVNVALHLFVRPQVTRGKGIELQIDEGNDTLDTASTINPEATPNPTFNISSIVTSVHIDSGDVVVLGGLKQDQLSNDDTGIPIIGKIPGVGRLFQNNIKAHDKKVLMVFIRPLILRNQKDAIQVTGGKYSYVRENQLEIARDQEEYEPRDSNPVLPPLRTADLPLPFSHPPIPPKIITK